MALWLLVLFLQALKLEKFTSQGQFHSTKISNWKESRTRTFPVHYGVTLIEAKGLSLESLFSHFFLA